MPIQVRKRNDQSLDIEGTVFRYRPMAPGEQAKIQSKHIRFQQEVSGRRDRPSKSTVEASVSGNTQEDVLQWGLIGWDNLLDADGKALPFEKGLIPWLPDGVRGKLYAAITGDEEGLSEDEEKN